MNIEQVKDYLGSLHCVVWGNSFTLTNDLDEAAQYIMDLFQKIENHSDPERIRISISLPVGNVIADFRHSDFWYTSEGLKYKYDGKYNSLIGTGNKNLSVDDLSNYINLEHKRVPQQTISINRLVEDYGY